MCSNELATKNTVRGRNSLGQLYLILDANVGALVGICSVWLAIGRGHWFARFLVFLPLLMAPILIDAYDMFYHHAFGTALIVLGIGAYRHWRLWQWRFTSRSMLLAMVVLAVFGAVFANTPEFGAHQWLGFLGIGAAIAAGTLLCVWTVCGRGKWWTRASVFLSVLTMFLVAGYFMYALHYDYYLNWDSGSSTWEKIRSGDFFEEYCDLDGLRWWFENHALSALTGSAVVLMLMLAARRGNWFLLETELPEAKADRTSSLCRVVFATLMVLLTIFPGYVFYRLLTPEPYPQPSEEFRAEFEELVAIGEEIGPHLNTLRTARLNNSPSSDEEFLAAVQPQLSRANQLLQKKGLRLGQYLHPANYETEWESLCGVLLSMQETFDYESANSEDSVAKAVSILRFAAAFHEESSFEQAIDYWARAMAANSLSELLGTVNSHDCENIVLALHDCDIDSDAFETRQQYQKLWVINSGWRQHLQVLLDESEDEDSFHMEWYELSDLLQEIRNTRALTLQFALQQYYLENDELPESLEELVPEYLPELVVDPVCQSPFDYELTFTGYTLRSTCDSDPNQALSVTGPAGPCRWNLLGKKVSRELWFQLGERIGSLGPSE